ncbi:MAG: NAD(P)-binding domain-containing protein [Cyclobacteriaceae bacterium]|nr:NAD(P)-binding domain-containing protein [Cyclobacteriaceae bacterium]
MKWKVGFIGAGRVTRIILQGFKNKKVSLDDVFVADTNTETSEMLRKKFPEIHIGDNSDVAAMDIVFIALHPPAIMDALETIRGKVSPKAMIISLAPKITIDKIASKLGNIRIARLIPNATSYINKGYNPVCFSGAYSAEEKGQILDLLSTLGTTFETAENKLEGYAIMSAMLPTYFWFQWKELLALGTQMNLDDKECKESIQHTLEAAMATFFQSGLSSDEVINLIPVKPIGEHEAQITGFYKDKLTALYEKIRT